MKRHLTSLLSLFTASWLGAGCNADLPGEEEVRSTSAELSSPTGSMYAPRVWHETATLSDGRVLVVGGIAGSGQTTNLTELYRPATNDWAFAGYLGNPRYSFTATRLSNGKVLVAGGTGSAVFTSAELFDPATNAWSATGSLALARSSHSATLLSDGRVLVTGGQLANGGNTETAELYNPATGTWSQAASMYYTRLRHTATRLTDGRVLVAGTHGSSTGAELYNPSTNTWSFASSTHQPRGYAASVLLPSGKVLVAGGLSSPATAELYDPATNTWTPTGSLTTGRRDHELLLLSNGDVLAVGGQDANGNWLTSVERWSATTGTWTGEASLSQSRNSATANLLSDGRVLVVGGYSAPGAELYSAGPCVPTTCAAQGKNCGSISDGCGGTLQCGTCGSGQTCTQNVCVAPSQVVTATYDSTRRVPVCATVGTECTSGTLLNGRGPLGPESNAPNTLNGSCSDGTAGFYHSDESLDRLRVVSVDGGKLAAGKQVRIEATAWVWGASSDWLDLYAAADASSPSWTFIGTVAPTASGSQVLSKTYTLPQRVGLQAIRGIFRYGGSASGPCVTGSYNDHDDLAFAVESGADVTAPKTTLTSPTGSAVVRGTVTLSASASDNVGVTRVEFHDGSTLLGSSTASPYSLSWNTLSVTNGAHTLSTRAYDAAGNVGTSASVTVTVDNDLQAPQVAVTAPAAGSTLTSIVTLSASASDNLGVTKVEFYLGDTLLGSDTVAPFELRWNSRSVANGTYALRARAHDAAGNVGTSADVSVTTNNDLEPPVVTLTSPTAESTVRMYVTISATATDNVAMNFVHFVVDGAIVGGNSSGPSYGYSWYTHLETNGPHTVQVIAYDKTGNSSTTPAVTVYVDNDLVPPQVSLTAPATGDTVRGVVTLTASASDNESVARVEFYDGSTRLGTNTKAPYTFEWNTFDVANGTHTLTARAYDPTNNMTTSESVTVEVANTAPTAAVYDATLRAPLCAGSVAACDTGMLLDGRASLGPEANAPNAVNGSCADGTLGTYHLHPSLDRLTVYTEDGGPLRAGATVRIAAKVYGMSSSDDWLDLYAAPEASSPVWTNIAQLQPGYSGQRTVSTTWTLPSAGRQVIRGVFRNRGSSTASPCPTNTAYGDVDDLVIDAQ